MPLAGCSSPSEPGSEPPRECDDPTQRCPLTERLVALTVVEGARQDGVVGADRWATVRHGTETVVVEAETEPNTPQVWSRLQWSGDAGQPVPGHRNRRRHSRSTSKVLRPAVSLSGDRKSLEVWVLAATIEIRSAGTVPSNAAPFDWPGATQDLGPTTFESFVGNVYPGDRYVLNMGARGKIVAIATLTPAGVHTVVPSGWTFRRERLTRHWQNGRVDSETTRGWTDDTSRPEYLRLTPDAADKIYDTDGPDIRWSTTSWEIYHNFREWVAWQSERCSGFGYWHFRAQWRANVDQRRQIVLNEVGPGQRDLPDGPAF